MFHRTLFRSSISSSPSSSSFFSPLRLLLAPALLLVACDFGTYTPVVPNGELDSPAAAALAISADATRLWVYDLEDPGDSFDDQLEVIDTTTGLVVAALGWGNDWKVRGLAPAHEPGYESSAWVLHANGYQLRWEPSLAAFSDWETPIPGSHFYCDIDRGTDGTHLVTTIDFIDGEYTGMLYRKQGNAWSSTVVAESDFMCPRVSYDEVQQVAVVLTFVEQELQRFDTSTLTLQSVADVGAIAGVAWDVASVGTFSVLAMDGSPDHLSIVDVDGNQTDSIPLGLARAVTLELDQGASEIRAWWTGTDGGYGAGNVTLE